MRRHIEDSSYQGENPQNLLLGEYNQNADIHPNELSGDEQGQRSVFATSSQDVKANFFLTTMTIVKTVIGSGILAIPFTMSKMGLVLGISMFFLAGAMSQYGAVMLLKSKNLSHHSNLSTIFYQIWQSKIAKSVGSVLIFLGNIGVCIAEMIIFKEAIHKILQDVLGEQHEIMSDFYTQTWFIVLVMAVVQTPLTLVSKMEKLKFMALAGVSGIVIFMISFVIFYLFAVADTKTENNPVGNMNLLPTSWFQAAAAVPNLMLALNYQVNIFPIYKGMRNVSDRRFTWASLSGIGFCIFSYLLVGILGYNYAGPTVKANFLTSLHYDKVDDIFFFPINFFFFISIFFAFPIMFFGCRNNFIALIKLAMLKDSQPVDRNLTKGDQVEDISSYLEPSKGIQQRRKRAKYHFVAYTIGIYLVIVVVSVLVDNIESVFNVVGAVCSTSISTLLPCFFYVKLIKLRKQPITWKYYLSLAIFGIMTPYALFSIIALYIQV